MLFGVEYQATRIEGCIDSDVTAFFIGGCCEPERGAAEHRLTAAASRTAVAKATRLVGQALMPPHHGQKPQK